MDWNTQAFKLHNWFDKQLIWLAIDLIKYDYFMKAFHFLYFFNELFKMIIELIEKRLPLTGTSSPWFKHFAHRITFSVAEFEIDDLDVVPVDGVPVVIDEVDVWTNNSWWWFLSELNSMI